MTIRGLAALLLVLVTLASASDVSSLTAKFEVRVYVDKYAYDKFNEIRVLGVSKDDQMTGFVKSLFYRVTAMFADIDKGIEMRLADVVIDKTSDIVEKPSKTWEAEELSDGFNEMIKEKNLSHVDHSILLSGLSLSCPQGDFFNRMCADSKSYSIIGFGMKLTTARIMAQKLGQSLGAKAQNKCKTKKKTPSIMTPTLPNSPKALRFSACSKDAIRRTIKKMKKSNSKCVNENAHQDAEQGKPLAELFGGVDALCAFTFGQGYFFDRGAYGLNEKLYNDTCYNGFRCTMGQRVQWPVYADGYACGKGKVCELGRCVPSDRSDLADVSDDCPLGDMPSPFKILGDLCSELTKTDCKKEYFKNFCCKKCAQN